jgi:hypothetical protein
MAGGLDVASCRLTYDDVEWRITHLPSQTSLALCWVKARRKRRAVRLGLRPAADYSAARGISRSPILDRSLTRQAASGDVGKGRRDDLVLMVARSYGHHDTH